MLKSIDLCIGQLKLIADLYICADCPGLCLRTFARSLYSSIPCLAQSTLHCLLLLQGTLYH